MKGVQKVDMNYKKGLYTLHVREGFAVSPSEIRKVVRKKFEIPKIEVSGLTGTVKKTKTGVALIPARQSKAVPLEEPKKKTPEGAPKTPVLSQLSDGQTVRIWGRLLEQAEGKTQRVVIEVSSMKPVANKKASG